MFQRYENNIIDESVIMSSYIYGIINIVVDPGIDPLKNKTNIY